MMQMDLRHTLLRVAAVCWFAGRGLTPGSSSSGCSHAAQSAAYKVLPCSNVSTSTRSRRISRAPSSHSSSCHVAAAAADVLTRRSTGGRMPTSHTGRARHHPRRHTNIRGPCEHSHYNQAPQPAQPRAAAYTQVGGSHLHFPGICPLFLVAP